MQKTNTEKTASASLILLLIKRAVLLLLPLPIHSPGHLLTFTAQGPLLHFLSILVRFLFSFGF